MIKQNYVTIKELDEKLDERKKNILINYVGDAVKHIEIMGPSCDAIIKGSNINEKEEIDEKCSSDKKNKCDIDVTNDGIIIYYNYHIDSWARKTPTFINNENRNELLAKSIILMFLLTALKDKGIGDITQIGLEDALAEENMTFLEKRIEELASRILIPKSAFTIELERDITKLLYNEEVGATELMTSDWLRQIFLEKLKDCYGVNAKMAKARLRSAVFNGEHHTPEEQYRLDEFVRYFEEEPKTKDPCMQMSDNKKNRE